MAFALFLGRRRDILVQLHPGSGYGSEKQESVSVLYVMLGHLEVSEIMWRVIFCNDSGTTGQQNF